MVVIIFELESWYLCCVRKKDSEFLNSYVFEYNIISVSFPKQIMW